MPSLVSPTTTDPVAASGSQILGGPRGRWAATGSQAPARALQVVLAVGTVTFLLGVLRTVPCIRIGWSDPDRYEFLCYSDIPILYSLRGLADGSFPYLTWPSGGQPLEYPILTGLFAWLSARVTSLFSAAGDPVAFYLISLVGLFLTLLIALAATSMTVPSRAWDGLLFAAAPALALAGTINWDLLAVALTATALLAWSRQRLVVAGLLLGLAISAKFYPLLILGPLAILAFRRRRIREFSITLAATAAAWIAVNIPLALAAGEGWSYFFRFSRERGQDFGSIWLALDHWGHGIPAETLNTVVTISLLSLCGLIAVLIWLAPRPPRLAQVVFLVVAVFVLVNKVYSPQFVLWLVPLAVLARPRWRDFLIWQAGEVVYFVAIWWYLAGFSEGNTGLPVSWQVGSLLVPWYALAILAHLLGTGYLCVMVVRDIIRPAHDPVRVDGALDDSDIDDPGGGVLDHAPDRLARRAGEPAAVGTVPGGHPSG